MLLGQAISIPFVTRYAKKVSSGMTCFFSGIAMSLIMYMASYTENFKNGISKRKIISLGLKIKSKYCIEIHAYCLMDNHYHLLAETRESSLSKGMRHINGVYTQWFNHKRKKRRYGHVFQGRFKAILVNAIFYNLFPYIFFHRTQTDRSLMILISYVLVKPHANILNRIIIVIIFIARVFLRLNYSQFYYFESN